jgi:putative endonuclease
MTKTHYVYIIKCGDGTYYTGYTIHLINRYIAHAAGKGAKYTKGRGPLDLMYYEMYDTKSEAMKREYRIKQLTHKQKTKLIYELKKKS